MKDYYRIRINAMLPEHHKEQGVMYGLRESERGVKEALLKERGIEELGEREWKEKWYQFEKRWWGEHFSYGHQKALEKFRKLMNRVRSEGYYVKDMELNMLKGLPFVRVEMQNKVVNLHLPSFRIIDDRWMLKFGDYSQEEVMQEAYEALTITEPSYEELRRKYVVRTIVEELRYQKQERFFLVIR